ncbi:hypothetical protein [Leptospira phage LE4]|uniref:Uncharacterized protein n=1 Tax=Leptospira phage LE4 TaxID=2041383 RepID=A0A343LEA7_9CAUD|nr:hypothetical protein HWB34_gp04 [Leptospira phage LE4]ATN95017.1 hypothetical protein [Leptospira phage LE4]
MNQLNKLIQQFAKEEDTPAFMIHALIREVEDEKGTWLNKLLEFLASRPTCGVEQRKFLDEVERFIIVDDLSGQAIARKESESPVMFQVHYIADLQKVIKGK